MTTLNNLAQRELSKNEMNSVRGGYGFYCTAMNSYGAPIFDGYVECAEFGDAIKFVESVIVESGYENTGCSCVPGK